jgi:hypothetical protein
MTFTRWRGRYGWRAHGAYVLRSPTLTRCGHDLSFEVFSEL